MTMPDYPVNRSIGAAAPGALGVSGIGGGGSGASGPAQNLRGAGAVLDYQIMTNASGAAVPVGTAVKVALGGAALSFTTTTVRGDERVCGVTLDAIAANGRGRVALLGFVRQVNVFSGTRGQWLRQSTKSGSLEGTDAPVHGSFGIQTSDLDATTGQASAFIGISPSAATYPFATETTAVDVTNTVTVTTVSDTSLPGDTLQTPHRLRLLAMGDCLNNTGVNHDITLSLALFSAVHGTTTLASTGTITLTASADRRAWRVVADLALPAAASEVGSMETLISLPSALAGAAVDVHGVYFGTAAVDLSEQYSVRLRAAWDAASASLSFRMKYAIAEIS